MSASLFIAYRALTRFISTSPYANNADYRTCSVIDIPEASPGQKRVTMKSRDRRRDFVIADLWAAMGKFKMIDREVPALNTFAQGMSSVPTRLFLAARNKKTGSTWPMS